MQTQIIPTMPYTMLVITTSNLNFEKYVFTSVLLILNVFKEKFNYFSILKNDLITNQASGRIINANNTNCLSFTLTKLFHFF